MKVRAIIRSTSQLAELRTSLRDDVAESGDCEAIVDDFVAAVNEVVAAAISENEPNMSTLDVRWRRRTNPSTELFAEIRSTAGTPRSLVEEGVSARLLQHYGERVDFDERIGGAVITVRCRV